MEKTGVAVNGEPRHEQDYSPRQTEAARRVLIDVGQVLATFRDCLVLVGGWVPDLLINDAEERHIGSIDVDLALEAEKLMGGRYAEMLKLLLDTQRYQQGEKPFQLIASVDLGDGGANVKVYVDFLAAKDVRLTKNEPKQLPGFRVLQADGCIAAFNAPEEVTLQGRMTRGAKNVVRLRVASLPDFLVMKALALEGRDKPKDAYDLCYCLDYCPGGIPELAGSWKKRLTDKDIIRAIQILREKFASPDAYGPMQVVEFYNAVNAEERARRARRAFELVDTFLELL
jgi:predicted nucleotidyltransferase